MIEVDSLHASIVAPAPRGTPRAPGRYNSPTMRPIVALLTDFGVQDHYVGAVKGAVLAVCSDAQLVDLTHGIPPHDIEAGAFALAASYSAFPQGTVFMAVVDPGVGTARRGIAVESGGYRFVGPDNGLLTLVLPDPESANLRAITNAGLFRSEVSSTFHARDIFGPVAAHLARGCALEEVGPAIQGIVLLPLPRARREPDGGWIGHVVHIDRFGNLTTSLTAKEFLQVLEEAGGRLGDITAGVGGRVLPVVGTYGDVQKGALCALMGSSGRLEIGVNLGSAAKALGLSKGALVRLGPAEFVL